MTSKSKTLIWSIVITVAMVAAVTAIGQPVAASHGNGDSSMIDPDSDYTESSWDSVFWGYGPNAYETGEQAGWAFRSTANDKRGGDFDLEYYEYVAIHAPWGDFSECAVTDTDVAGIDRGDDNWEGDPRDPSNDESLVQDIENSGIYEHYGYFQFAGPDSFGDRGIHLNHTDSFTAGLSCFNNPDEEGWYRLTVWFNGTGYDGEKKEFINWNDWKYFCDNAAERCSDRQEAIETLGPPPSEVKYPTGERVQNYEPDSPWAHTSGPPGSSEDEQGDEGTDTPTATAEQNDAGGDSSTPAGTPTPTSSQDNTGGDSSTTSTQQNDGEQTTQQDDGGQNGGSTQQSDGGQNGDSTPTAGDGPGLGSLAALLALLSAAIHTRRRS